MLKEFNITLDVKKELISNKITGLNLNDLATIKIKFVQNSLPYDINNKDIRIDYRLPDGVLLFQNQNTGVTKIDGNTIDIQVINQALQQVGDVTLDISIFFKDTSKKITTSKLILKVDSIIYKEEQLSTDFDALQTALNDSKKLESKFGTAKDLDNKLQQDFKTGNALDNTLKEDIKNADTSKSNLDTTISTANTANNNLKNTINKADTTTYATRGEVKTLTTQYEETTKQLQNFIGSNLLRYSGYPYYDKLKGLLFNTQEVMDSINCLAFKHSANIIPLNNNDLPILETGSKYTFSFWAKTNENTNFEGGLYLNNSNLCLALNDNTLTTNWKKYITTFTWRGGEIDSSNQFRIHLYPVISKNNKPSITFYLANWKLEKGTIATDWTPNVKDYNELVDVQNNRLDAIEKILIDKGYMTVTQKL